MEEPSIDPIDIEPSKLGTKDFWDQRYEKELENFKEFSDEGEIWFGISAENRILSYMKKNAAIDCKVLDLGCGNGSVLRRLRNNGYQYLVGVDYCPAAIELAKSASEVHDDVAASTSDIQYKVFDITSEKDRSEMRKEFAYVLDKGTWDAMSLSEDRDLRLSAYKSLLKTCVIDGGKLILFSCNFTRSDDIQLVPSRSANFSEELRKQFESEWLKFESEIPAAHSFSFGGKQGVTSTGIVFRVVFQK